MNKDYFIINAADQMEAASLRFVRSYCRHFFREHEKASPDEVRSEFLNHLKFIYKFYMYEVFHDPEHFKFVKRVESIEEGPDSFTPIFTIHDDMYSTMIKRTQPNSINNIKDENRKDYPR